MGCVVHQLLALHQPCQATELCGKPAASSHLALRDLGSELCMSMECHLVGFYFIIHISFKKLCFVTKYSIVHRFDASLRGENKLINANFPYSALSQQLLSNCVFASPFLA